MVNREQDFDVNLANLPANTIVKVHLLYFNDTTGTSKELNSAEVQVNAAGLVALDVGMIPSYAPTGRYLFVAGDPNKWINDSIAESLDQSGLVAEPIEIGARLDQIVIAEVKQPNLSDSTCIKVSWKDKFASADDTVKLVWYKNDKGLVEYHSNVLTESTGLFQVLTDDRQGTQFCQPIIGPFFVPPGLPHYLPDYPTLVPGEYHVEVNINGVKEGSEEIVVK